MVFMKPAGNLKAIAIHRKQYSGMSVRRKHLPHVSLGIQEGEALVPKYFVVDPGNSTVYEGASLPEACKQYGICVVKLMTQVPTLERRTVTLFKNEEVVIQYELGAYQMK
jgi:hypothetical protein